jgi:hypothetical protein
VDALHQFINRNDFRNHPRLRRLTITGPEGEIENYDPFAKSREASNPG